MSQAAASPTPPPTALLCTRPITNTGALRMALITSAKPLKNSRPVSASSMASSSSKLAPAQKALPPSLRSTITRTSGSLPASSMAWAMARRMVPGRLLLLGWWKVTVAMPSAMSVLT